MAADAYIADNELEKQLQAIKDAQDDVVQGRSLAMLTVLLSRCSDSNFETVSACVPLLTDLAQTSPNKLVQANAVAALAASASLDDTIAANVAASASRPLAELLQHCAAHDAAADLQLNVVAALGQLARDQQAAVDALMSPEVLPCLLALADSSKPEKLQEAVADALCALTTSEADRPQLLQAGAVTSALGLLNVDHMETSVRCLLMLGMLLPSSPAAKQQLAGDAKALQQVLQLLKQQQDLDAKLLARDVIRLLLVDEALKDKVEAAIRQAGSDSS